MTTPIDKVPAAKDKPLFTPGPLTTSLSVKQAMLRDLGSRDKAFIATIQRVSDQLLEVAGLSAGEGYEAVLMQGSGTFGIESVLGSTVPPDGKLLVVINGAYRWFVATAAMSFVHNSALIPPLFAHIAKPYISDQARKVLGITST